MKLQQYLYKLKLITKRTSYAKIKCNNGISKLGCMLYELVKNSDFVGFQKLVSDYHEVNKK